MSFVWRFSECPSSEVPLYMKLYDPLILLNAQSYNLPLALSLLPTPIIDVEGTMTRCPPSIPGLLHVITAPSTSHVKFTVSPGIGRMASGRPTIS